MKKVCVVTATRAEYGILTPLIKRIQDDEELELRLVVTGTHLSHKHGMTVNQIEKDGFAIDAFIPILEEGNRACDVSITVANAVKGFSQYFSKNRPDMVVVLGDRTEMLGVAIAAMNENIMICHIHGGEVTEGAVDDCVRHALTKISYLHFTGTEVYRNRVIQLGEAPDRVFNVGTLSAENILTVPLMSEEQIREDIGIVSGKDYVVVTLHPETVDNISSEVIAAMLCEVMKENSELFYIITAANADAGGDKINQIFQRFAEENKNVYFESSLGMKRYLSAVKSATFVLGNSSSGIVEAPILGVPTINIGNRQKGRIMAETIINVPFEKDRISTAIKVVKLSERKPSTIYGEGKTSEKMVKLIKQFIMQESIDLKKRFYDLESL